MPWEVLQKKNLNVPEKPKLKCLGFTYNGAKLFSMLPIQMKKTENPNTFKTFGIGLTPLIALIYISMEPAVAQNCVASVTKIASLFNVLGYW